MDGQIIIDFSTIAGVAAFDVAVSAWLIGICKVTKNWLKQLISWVLPVVICAIAYLLQFGLFADYGTIAEWQGWVLTAVTALGIGLIANGIYDIEFVKMLIEGIKKLFTKKQRS